MCKTSLQMHSEDVLFFLLLAVPTTKWQIQKGKVISISVDLSNDATATWSFTITSSAGTFLQCAAHWAHFKWSGQIDYFYFFCLFFHIVSWWKVLVWTWVYNADFRSENLPYIWILLLDNLFLFFLPCRMSLMPWSAIVDLVFSLCSCLAHSCLYQILSVQQGQLSLP